MAVRSSMSALILRVRLLINDTLAVNAGQIFTDDEIQDVMDESRIDYFNEPLLEAPTFSGSTISYFDYLHPLGGWEDNTVLKQYLTVPVTPSISQPIAGRWTFATSTLPPIMLTSSLHDVYRASADLLDRWAAQWTLLYSVSVDGQGLQRAQVAIALQTLAKTYRMKQRPIIMQRTRGDIRQSMKSNNNGLGPNRIDFFASGIK